MEIISALGKIFCKFIGFVKGEFGIMIDMGFGIVELELGTLLLFLSLIAILLDGFFILLGRYFDEWEILSETSAVAGSALLTASFFYFCYSFLTADYDFVAVSTYISNDDTDIFLRLSAIWSGEVGSYFLWAFFLILFYVPFRFYFRDIAHEPVIWRAFVLASFQVAFLIALTLISEPFQLNDDPKSDGFGLNPLLRNIWNFLHPPPIFLGYAACMVPTAIAMARISLLKDGEILDFEGKRRLDKFFDLNVSLAWLILTVGIIIGGYWAYITLGWGGFWAWDPVETASLIPWLFLTLYYHGTSFHRNSKYLANYIISMTYTTALLATFATRSDLVTSVHTYPQGENIVVMFLHFEWDAVFDKLLNDFQPKDSILFLLVILLLTFILPHIWGILNRELFRIDLSLQKDDFQVSKSKTTALKISYIAFLGGTYLILLGLIAPILYDFVGNLYSPIFDEYGPNIVVGIDYYNIVGFIFGGIVLLAGFFCKFYPETSFKAKLSLLAGGIGAGVVFYAGGQGTLDQIPEQIPIQEIRYWGRGLLEFMGTFWTTSDKANLVIPLIFLGLGGTFVTVVRVMLKEEKNFFRKSSQAILHFSLLLILLGALLSSNKPISQELVVEENFEYSIEGTSLKILVLDLRETYHETGRFEIEFDVTFQVRSASNTKVGVTRLAIDRIYGSHHAVTILSDLFADIYVVTTGIFQDPVTGRFAAAQLQVKVIPFINFLWVGCFFLILAVLPLPMLRAAEFKSFIKKTKAK